MKTTKIEAQRAKNVAQMEREYEMARATGKKRMGGLTADQIRVLIDNFSQGRPTNF